MAFAYTTDRIALGAGFPERLRAIVQRDHAERLAQEQISVRRIAAANQGLPLDETSPLTPVLAPYAAAEHVGATYEALIEGSVQGVIAQGLALEKLGVKAIKAQIAGHVETEPGAFGFSSAHVWPADVSG